MTTDPVSRLKYILKTTSQRKLAKSLGMSQAFISDVVRRKKAPSDRLLRYLGVRKVTTYEVVR